MPPLTISIVSALTPPPEGSQLVIFSDARNYVAEYESGPMIQAAARYARGHRVHVMPGRFIAGGHLCLCLLDPDGVPLGVQRACHLNLDYRGRFTRASAVEPFKTQFGRVALLVDVDINLPQTPRAAVEAGAELLLSSQFIQLFDFFEDRVRSGTVNAAVTNGVPVAASIGAGGAVVDSLGRAVAGYSEELPIVARVEPRRSRVEHADLVTARRLLTCHRELLTDETGGAHV